MDFIKKHCDFKVYPVTWLAILVAILVVPCIKYLPQTYGYENGLLENLQLFVLAIACYLGFTAKTNKTFFKFVGLIVIMLMLREVNCGRTIFFPVPGEVNTFYKWKDIKYGYLAHPLYGIYIASVVIYFLWNKLFVNLWQIIKNVKIPVWNILLLITGMSLGMYAEKCLHNMVFEEITELLFYVSLVGIVWLYGFNEKFFVKSEV